MNDGEAPRRCGVAIFDFDGTLADTLPLFVPLTNVLAARHGFRPIDEREIDELRGLGPRDMMARLGIPLWKLHRIAADYRSLVDARTEPMPLFAGVPSMLARLSAAGIRMAILSSNSGSVVERALGDERARFEVLDCGVSLFGKSRRLRRLVRAIDADPAEVIYIGDELRDGAAAREAGLAFGGVAWGYTRPDALRAGGADRWFDDIDDIARITA